MKVSKSVQTLPDNMLADESLTVEQVLKKYRENTAIFRFEFNGKMYDWAIAAVASSDSKEDLIDHLHRYIPGSKVKAVAIH